MSNIFLKDRIKLEYGFSVRVNNEKEGVYPVFGSNGITGYIDTYKVNGPGIIIGRKGTVGAVSYSKDNFTPTDTAYYVVLKNSKTDSIKFWYYYLSLIGLDKLNTHSSVPGLSREIAYFLEVSPPDISTQQKISSVLSSLDSKIELNKRINAKLEAMAKTLYDYWFVQFDFPDKNGKPYKSSGGKMVWNAELKREIPEGWEIESIEQCCDIVDCLHSKKPDYTYEDENSYLLQLENLLDNGLIDISNKYYVSSADYKTWISRIEVKENDILITNAGRVAATVQVSKEIVSGIGRNITAIRPLTVKPTYLFLSFRGIDMLRQIKWNTDSGAFFSSFNVKGIKKLYILKPASFIEKQFEIIAYSFRRKRELIQVENSFLCQLRDFLLPMLMNGQVKVQCH